MQHLLEKLVTSSRELRSTRDSPRMHQQEPEFYLVHEERISPETHRIRVLAPMSLFHKEATCKSSTINGLLYADETLIVAQRCDVPWD